MDILLIHKIIVILIATLCAWLGSWIYFSNRKSKINQTFSLAAFFLFFWVVFGYLGQIFLKDPYWSTIFIRINIGAVCLFFIAFYFFSVYFPKQGKKHPVLDKSILIFWSIFAFLSFFTDLIVKDVRICSEMNVVPYTDVLGNIFLLASLLVAIFIFVSVFKKYFKLPGVEKLKTQYFLLGLSLFILFNVVFNIILPLFFSQDDYYAFGDYSAIFLLSFTALAIAKRELFDIKVILTDMLVAMMAILLLVLPFIVETSFLMRALMLGIFLLFCFMGYFLVCYTHQEARQKQVLEQQVQERTQKIQEQLDELNRWHKATIGREMKMIELKKEIKELEKQIK